jgi:hypothetical protein
MTSEVTLLLTIIVITTLRFAFDWVPGEVVALGVVLAVALTGLFPTDDVFAGFGTT